MRSRSARSFSAWRAAISSCCCFRNASSNWNHNTTQHSASTALGHAHHSQFQTTFLVITAAVALPTQEQECSWIPKGCLTINGISWRKCTYLLTHAC
jgi:hypothetical protein